MPGNEIGDRLHNFFAQENFSQGQHQAQVLDGNWPALNNNLLVGNQRSIGVLGSNPKGYNLQQPVVDTAGRGPGSHLLSGPRGMNFAQSSPRPEVSRSQLQSQQQNYNDYMYGHLYQARQDEGNFLAVNIGSDQRNVASVGSSFYESQGLGPEHQTHTPVRSEASESPGSFDLFGSQHQFSSHQSNLLQPLQRQQPGFNDMHQQVMLMRMQELQRQQLQQLDARQQNTLNQISPFPKVTAGGHSSSLVNGNINSGALSYQWATETGNANWLQRNSPALQGSSNGLISTSRAQGQNLMGLIPQQTDQSLYGVPVSNSRACAQMMTDRTCLQQTDSFNNLFPGNQYFALPDQLGGQDREPTSKQKFQGESSLGHAPGESLNSAINMENLQQVNLMQSNTAAQEFQLRHELALPSVNSMEKTAIQAASSQNDVGLDPTEERILFGSDDNIWAAFGKSTDLSGEARDSGTWSALMQSAVGETSSTDVQPREEWSGLNIHIMDVPSGNQNISTCNSGKQPNSFAEGKAPIASSLNSEPVRPSDCTNVNNSYCNPQGFQQSGHKLPYETGGLQTNSSPRLVQPSEEGSRWMDAGSLQRAGVVHGGASYKADPGPGPTVDLQPGRSSVANTHVNSEIIGLNAAGIIPKPSSMKSADESTQFLSSNSQTNYWKNANAFAKSKGSEGLEGAQSRIIRDNQLLNSLQTTSDREVKTHEMDNRDKQENSNDSYHSNVSHRISAGSLRGNALSDVSDSRAGKEKSTNQVSAKNSTRKFQYHPMGNLDEDIDPAHGVKKPFQNQVMVQQNAHFGQSMFSTQRQSSDGLRDGKGLADTHSQSCFLGSGSNMSAPLNRPVDIHSPNVDSPSSPNMLQLLQKVDQSREFGATMHQNASSEMPEAENSDGSVAHLQRIHSSASQGYGLQLGPPSQSLPAKNHLLSSQGSMQAVNSSFLARSASEIGENGQAQVAPPSQVQSLSNSRGTVQGELTINRSGVLGNSENESTRNKMHGKFSSALSSGYMYSRSLPENQQMVTGQGLTNQSNSSFKHAPNSTEKDDSHEEPSGGRSVEIFSRDVIGNSPHANLPTSLDTAKPTSSRNPFEGFSAQQKSVEHLSVSQPTAIPGISQQRSSSEAPNNMSANAYAHLFGVQFRKEPSEFPCSDQLNIVESSSSALGNQDETNGRKFSSKTDANSINSLGDVQGEMKQVKSQSSKNIDLVQKLNESQGEATVKTISDVSPLNSTSMQKDIETFGQSLKPNNFSHHNYLINQMRAMKNMETEQGNMMLKRTRVPDGSPGGQQMSHASPTSADSGMLSLSGSDNLERNRTAQQGSVPTQDIPALCQYDSQGSLANSTSSVKREHTQITSQMAQSWFNRYGTGKNGQTLPMYEAQKAAAMQIAEPPFNFGKPSNSFHAINSMPQLMPANIDSSQHSNVGPSSLPTPPPVEHFPYSQSLSANMIDQHSVPRPKKRLRVTEDLCPWYKEVSQDLQDLQNISGRTLERDWAKGTNRFTEKVEEDISSTDVHPRQRARKRLLLTTQLMQQLFHPPPASVLTADAKLEFENVAYLASRLALGSACGLVSSFNGNTSMAEANNDKEPSFDKRKASDGNGDQHFTKIVEEFAERKRKLEDVFSRLDNSASVLDLTLESQDLDKFSIINRFAMFHGRALAKASSSSDAAARTYKVQPQQPQRYVSALPMPKDLPIGVHCVSL